MLQQVNSSHAVWFNYEDKKWEWDLARLAAMNISEDVIEFLLEELHKRTSHCHKFTDQVPLETRDVLRIAACLGNKNFRLVLISQVMNLSRFEVARRLWPAQESCLISSDQSFQVYTQASTILNLDAINGNRLFLVQ